MNIQSILHSLPATLARALDCHPNDIHLWHQNLIGHASTFDGAIYFSEIELLNPAAPRILGLIPAGETLTPHLFRLISILLFRDDLPFAEAYTHLLSLQGALQAAGFVPTSGCEYAWHRAVGVAPRWGFVLDRQIPID